jgi:psp operon transcriptional activator
MAISATEPELPPIVGQSAAFQAMLAEVSRLAPLDRPVLVVGERGTGKELVASRLAYLSRRWDKPIVKVNCAALPESLLDSELFGHEAGAFTGAMRRRAGRFELADGGTLFLDEIAQASGAVQEKILRAAEYGVFDRVGGGAPVRVDVRLVAATNIDLPEAVAAGRFRADLLDRLAFDVVTLPPLRARPEDIPILAAHFATGMAREMGRGHFAGFTPAAEAQLLAHSWPGNVRELKNAVERSVARSPRSDRPLDAVVIDPFATDWRPPAPPASLPSPPEEPPPQGFETRVAAFEARLLEDALAANRFNQIETARALGLGYHQLRHLLRKHKIGRGAERKSPSRARGRRSG